MLTRLNERSIFSDSFEEYNVLWNTKINAQFSIQCAPQNVMLGIHLKLYIKNAKENYFH